MQRGHILQYQFGRDIPGSRTIIEADHCASSSARKPAGPSRPCRKTGRETDAEGLVYHSGLTSRIRRPCPSRPSRIPATRPAGSRRHKFALVPHLAGIDVGVNPLPWPLLPRDDNRRADPDPKNARALIAGADAAVDALLGKIHRISVPGQANSAASVPAPTRDQPSRRVRGTADACGRRGNGGGNSGHRRSPARQCHCRRQTGSQTASSSEVWRAALTLAPWVQAAPDSVCRTFQGLAWCRSTASLDGRTIRCRTSPRPSRREAACSHSLRALPE